MAVTNVTVTNDGEAEVRVYHINRGVASVDMDDHITEVRVLKAGDSITFGVLRNSYLEVQQH